MKKVTIAERLGQIDEDRPDIIDGFQVDGNAMIGLAHIAAGSTDHFWERHDGGDEILYLLAGRAVFTSIAGDGAQAELAVSAGDLIFLARNEAHRARVTEDLKLIFVTPEDGNAAWTDTPDAIARH
jgi:quercetin dioxygenase-like cupin family protein